MTRTKRPKPKSDSSAKVNVTRLDKTIVQIEWDDSCSMARWRSHDEITNFANDTEQFIKSVGIIVGDTKDYITIVQSVSQYNKEAAMKIPKVAIKSIKKIGEI